MATTYRQWKSNKLTIQLHQTYQKVRLTFFNQTINRLSYTASEPTIPQAELGRHIRTYMYIAVCKGRKIYYQTENKYSTGNGKKVTFTFIPNISDDARDIKSGNNYFPVSNRIEYLHNTL